MARMPGAIWKPVARKARGAMPRAVRLNLHVAVSESSSLFSFFNQSGTADSHFYVRRDGTIEQYVDTSLNAYADLQGNSDSISVETQGGLKDPQGEPWTEAQVEALARIYAWVVETHGIAEQIAKDSVPGVSSHGLSWHRLGIDGNFPAYPLCGRRNGGLRYSKSGGKVCPGDAKIKQIPEIFARAQEILHPKPVQGAEETPATILEAIAKMTVYVFFEGPNGEYEAVANLLDRTWAKIPSKAIKDQFAEQLRRAEIPWKWHTDVKGSRRVADPKVFGREVPWA